MQKSLKFAAILSLLTGSAYAVCPSNPSDCPPVAASVVTTPNLQVTGTAHMSGLLSGTQLSCLGLNSSSNIVTAACGSGGGGGGIPGGTTGQVQFNNSGAFGGLTNTQLTADINVFTSALSGAVPASGGGTTNLLRADGTWAPPPPATGLASLTTTVSVNAATAPTTGQVLTATGPTQATWQASASLPPTTLTTGASITFVAPRYYAVCTSACTITVPVPAPGYEFCVMNDNNVSTVITLSAIGSSARYENTARSAYGAAGTGTLVSGGSVGDKVCIVGRDSTHYLTASYTGVWVAN